MRLPESVTVVVLPTLGGGSVRRSVREALGQRDVQVDVLVPGGAMDETDRRVRALPVAEQAHPAVLLDAAIAAGCARWLAFLEVGARWHPDHLRHGLTAAEEVGADWSYGGRVLVDRLGEVVGVALAERPAHVAAALRTRNAVGGPSSVMCRTAVAAEERPFDQRLHALVHWAAWEVLARRPAAACTGLLVAECSETQRPLLEPRTAFSELEQLRREGRLARDAPAVLELADALRALGHRRAAAAGYARSAVGHRRPQDLVRSACALAEFRPARAGHAPPRYEAPRWLTGGAPRPRRWPVTDGGRPEVSVIVATRNRPAFLGQAVSSALAQDVPLEVLVVDDASDHRDAVAALSFPDPRVRVHRRASRGGAGRARNDALELARGRWVAFLDDDDLMAPRRLATHLDHAGEAGFSFCGQLLVDSARRVVGARPAPRADRLAERLRVGSLIGGPSAVVARTTLAREVGGFRDDLYALGDWDLWLKLAARAGGVALPELLVAYTVHATNMHLRAPGRMLEDFRRFDALHRVGTPAEAALLAWLAEELGAAGEYRAAARMHLRLARLRGHPNDLVRAARAGLHRGARTGAAPELEPWPWLGPYRCHGGEPADATAGRRA
jgi:hypothetical protein